MVHRTLAALLLAAACASPAAADAATRDGSPSTAGVDDPDVLSVLVLGDSYSAGNGAGGAYTAGSCHRSPRNYGGRFEQLVEEHDPGQQVLVDTHACSGAKIQDYWQTQNADAGSPQRDWVDPSDDVVMLTLGGNDLHFTDIVSSCLISFIADEDACAASLAYAEGRLADGSLRDDLHDVLADILDRTASDTVVVLMGYPYLERNENLEFGQLDLGRRLTALVDDGSRLQAGVVADLAATYGDRVVYESPRDLFAGRTRWLPATERGHRHELGKDDPSPDRWIVQPGTDEAVTYDFWYHPNPTGWSREGELLFRDPRVPVSDAPDPLAIRPGGLGPYPVGVDGQVLADAGLARHLPAPTPCAGSWSSTRSVDARGLWLSAAAGDPDDIDLFQSWRGTRSPRYPIHTREGVRVGTRVEKLRSTYQRELTWRTRRVDGGWSGGYLMFGPGGALFFDVASSSGRRPPTPQDATKVSSIEAYPGLRAHPDAVPLSLGVC